MLAGAEVLRIQLDYCRWANRRLVEVAGTLPVEELTRDFGTADKSVLGTLVHIYASERTWLRRLLGAPAQPFVTDGDYRLSVVQEDWPALEAQWHEWAASLTDVDASKQLAYNDLRGNAWEQPVWQIVLHAVNHGTHHRGQVSGFLRSMGRIPPPLDLIRYYRDGR